MLRRFEDDLIERAIAARGRAKEDRTQQMMRQFGEMYGSDPERMIKNITDRTRGPVPLDMAEVRRDFKSMNQDDFLNRYVPNMSRGQGGFGSVGVKERAYDQFATNAWVRRGAYPSLAAGGAIAGGVALTEAAQQLMGLTAYIEAGNQQAARAENSPLA